MFSKENVEEALKTKVKSQTEINKMKNILYRNHIKTGSDDEQDQDEEEEQKVGEMTEERLNQMASNIDKCDLNDEERKLFEIYVKENT